MRVCVLGRLLGRRSVGARGDDGGGGCAWRRPNEVERDGEDQDGGAADGTTAAEPVDLATCVRPPLNPRIVAQLPPTNPQAQGSCRLCRRAASLSRAVLGGEAELGARACECAVTAGGAGAGDAGGDDDY